MYWESFLFHFHLRSTVEYRIIGWLFFFPYSILNMSSLSYFWPPWLWWESDVNLIMTSLNIICPFFFWEFQIFYLSFNSLLQIYVWVNSILSIIPFLQFLGCVHEYFASDLRRIHPYLFIYFFCSFSSLLSILAPIIYMLVYIMVSHKFLSLCSF